MVLDCPGQSGRRPDGRLYKKQLQVDAWTCPSDAVLDHADSNARVANSAAWVANPPAWVSDSTAWFDDPRSRSTDAYRSGGADSRPRRPDAGTRVANACARSSNSSPRRGDTDTRTRVKIYTTHLRFCLVDFCFLFLSSTTTLAF